MNIFCVARNYALHADEMKSSVPTEPVFFLKPDSALASDQEPFLLPDFSHDIQHEIEIVVRIEHRGKDIPLSQAASYYHSVALGIDFTARDLQSRAKATGMPWMLSKGFDGSAVVSAFVPLAELQKEINGLHFSLLRNGTAVQTGNSGDMIFSVDRLITHLSHFVTLSPGDIIYTGTPAGVGSIGHGDHLDGILEGRTMLSLDIK